MKSDVEVGPRYSQLRRDQRRIFAAHVDASQDVPVARSQVVEQSCGAPTRGRLGRKGVVDELVDVSLRAPPPIDRALAMVVDDRVAEEPVEPRARPRGIFDGRGVLGSSRERALYDVLGIGSHADAALCERDEARPLAHE